MGYALTHQWRSTRGPSLAALIAGLAAALTSVMGLAAESSLSDIEVEQRELKLTLEKVLGENKQLRNTLADTEKTLSDMRKSLTNAEGEGEIFKRQTMELKLKIEALGLDSGSAGGSKLEQRLLAAVNDLRVTTEENKKLAEALVRLSEAASLFAKTSGSTNVEGRTALEAELRYASLAMGSSSPGAPEAPAVPATMTDAMAISVKDDLALVVINLGRKQGVKVGMPFQVIRDGHLIGGVRVVDVRERFAGAVIQALYSEKDRVKVGDHLKLDTQQ